LLVEKSLGSVVSLFVVYLLEASSGILGRELPLFSFVGVEKSKWKHLQGKLQDHCSKREFSKDCINGAVQKGLSSIDLFSKGRF
jgi:hypothetical protein